MMKVSLTLLFLTLGGLSQPTPEKISKKENCDPSWVKFKKACYKRFNASVSWPEAENHCLQQNSHLASIHSHEENDFVFSLMGKPSSPFTGAAYWIGVHDLFKEGMYMNIDGSKVTFLKFGKDQPDNRGDEDYIGTWYVENGRIGWNDYPLKPYIYPFVCKYYLGYRLCRTDGVSNKQ